MKRTYASETVDNVGKEVKLLGWTQTVRDHGKVAFIDLKDASGQVQTVTRKNIEAGEGDVVEITGTVKERPKKLVNPDLETGTVEVEISTVKIISKTKITPIPTSGDGHEIDENLRLKYRYLDLRRERLQNNLKLRHRVSTLVRNYLNEQGFVEIETPYLSKTTPEGSRDFLVPSRLQPPKFYALAQAPQQYKQLLMIAGFEKYFQFARAFRDEDMRSDRQYEHTQIDIEMAFVEREDVMNLVENMYKYVAKDLERKILKDPFPKIAYDEAMKIHGSDKFDLREKSDSSKLAFAWVVDFPLLVYDEKEKRYTFSHNPFCSPQPDQVKNLMEEKNLSSIKSFQYDLVLNGEEVGGGSIRITDPKIQRQVFKVMGYSGEKIEKDFGHLLEAYEYGAPYHGGIALGLDRFIAVLSGEKSIREVIAFPTSGSGQTSVMDAPTEVDEKTLKEYHLKKI